MPHFTELPRFFVSDCSTCFNIIPESQNYVNKFIPKNLSVIRNLHVFYPFSLQNVTNVSHFAFYACFSRKTKGAEIFPRLLCRSAANSRFRRIIQILYPQAPHRRRSRYNRTNFRSRGQNLFYRIACLRVFFQAPLSALPKRNRPLSSRFA